MHLAVNTAVAPYGLALFDTENFVLLESRSIEGRELTQDIATVFKNLTKKRGVTYQDLTSCSVIIGPGSYTSIRIGLSFVKTVAQCCSLPVLGLVSLEAVALAYYGFRSIFFVILASRKGEYHVQLFSSDGTQVIALSESLILSTTALYHLAKDFKKKVLFVGVMNDDLKELLKKVPTHCSYMEASVNYTSMAYYASTLFLKEPDRDFSYKKLNPYYAYAYL